ncbi:MAG TPA: hypothetical protein HA349_06115 [Methanotrichaceae archaeon]|nr:hypothetical protein [Methanotrichaceae archaeon]
MINAIHQAASRLFLSLGVTPVEEYSKKAEKEKYAQFPPPNEKDDPCQN